MTRLSSEHLHFDNNHLLQNLYGEQNRHLEELETLLDIEIAPRGNQITVKGAAEQVEQGVRVLNALYHRLEQGFVLEKADIIAAVRLEEDKPTHDKKGELPLIKTKRKVINPRSKGQAAYLSALEEKIMVFGIGPAGTGKTYLAVAKAVECLMAGTVSRIILSRPAVEAGENLGFLPGDLKMKIDPYLRPLYDALYDMLPMEVVQKKLEAGDIEIAPLAFMRGRTLSSAFVILDEAQNATHAQMKMFLTRLGEGSRMVITGDPTQVDLPHTGSSGLLKALAAIAHIPEIAVIHFNDKDVVRHPLVGKIVAGYAKIEG
jgi:phosphate starvation-inducible protein PhoH and related proteins